MNRSAKRFKTNENAQLEVYGHVGVLKASVGNLSKTGALLELSQGDYLPQKGDLLSITVHLHTLKKEHHLAAEVVWTTGVSLGVCFIQQEEILERMMAKASLI